MKLPANLLETAWGNPTDPKRVYAWTRLDIGKTVEWLRRAGYAILGGDVWVVAEDGTLRPDNPRTGANRRSWCWGAPDRGAEQHWNDFVDRCAEHTLIWIRDVDPDSTLAIEPGETIIYEPTWVSEAEHQDFQARHGA